MFCTQVCLIHPRLSISVNRTRQGAFEIYSLFCTAQSNCTLAPGNTATLAITPSGRVTVSSREYPKVMAEENMQTEQQRQLQVLSMQSQPVIPENGDPVSADYQRCMCHICTGANLIMYWLLVIQYHSTTDGQLSSGNLSLVTP